MSRLVYGLQPVREAIRAHGAGVGWVLVQRDGGPKLDALARLAEGQGIPTERAPRGELDRRSAGGRHQGAVASAPELQITSPRWAFTSGAISDRIRFDTVTKSRSP